jgi:hypothetical protein
MRSFRIPAAVNGDLFDTQGKPGIGFLQGPVILQLYWTSPPRENASSATASMVLRDAELSIETQFACASNTILAMMAPASLYVHPPGSIYSDKVSGSR